MSQPPAYPQTPPEPQAIPPKKSNTVLWVVLILGVGGLCFLIIVMAAILFPVFSQARLSAQRTACLSKVKMQSTALLMYAAENDDHFPPAKSWMDKTADYASGDSAFQCPIVVKDSGEGAFGFGFNEALSGLATTKIKDEERTVAVFESKDTGRNALGGEQDVVVPGRHGGSTKGNNFGYVDGHAKYVPDGAASHLWKP